MRLGPKIEHYHMMAMLCRILEATRPTVKVKTFSFCTQQQLSLSTQFVSLSAIMLGKSCRAASSGCTPSVLLRNAFNSLLSDEQISKVLTPVQPFEISLPLRYKKSLAWVQNIAIRVTELPLLNKWGHVCGKLIIFKKCKRYKHVAI